jgi:hypothetical protein
LALALRIEAGTSTMWNNYDGQTKSQFPLFWSWLLNDVTMDTKSI